MSQFSQALIPVTVAVPVKNEEANLARCLERLGRFAEIVVIDSGSTDRTPEIAREYGARLVDFQWNRKYPKKRNWLLLNSPPKQDWVFFLDADELVTGEFCDEVLAAIAQDQHDAFWLRYTNYFLDRPLKHGDPQRKLALFKVGKGLYEKIEEDSWSNLDMEVHEHPVIDGVVGEIRAPIDHRDDRGVAKFIQRHQDYALWEAKRTLQLRQSEPTVWEELTPRQRKKYRHIDKWWFAWAYFVASYIFKRGFLDGEAGFAYAFYKLWYFWTIRLLIKEQGTTVL